MQERIYIMAEEPEESIAANTAASVSTTDASQYNNVPVAETVIIDDSAETSGPDGINNANSTTSDEEAAHTIRGLKIIIVGLLIVIGFITGVIPAILSFIWGIISIALCVIAVYYIVKVYKKFYNSDFARRGREREAARKARKQAKRAVRGGLGLVDIAILSAVDGMGSVLPSSPLSGPIPPKTASWDDTPPSTSNIDQDAYWRKKQSEQQAYWHRNQASGYVPGSSQQQYHDNAAARAQYDADHTTYR